MPTLVSTIHVRVTSVKPRAYDLTYVGIAEDYESLVELVGKEHARAALGRAEAAGMNQSASQIEIPVFAEDPQTLELEHLNANAARLEKALSRTRLPEKRAYLQKQLEDTKAHLKTLQTKPARVKH